MRKFDFETDTILIRGFTFVASIKSSRGESDVKDTVLKLYRIENEKPKYLLRHFIYMSSGDCNNTFEDFGFYEIHSDSIIFLTEFSQSGSDPVPLERKQIYVVQPDGKLFLVSDKELFQGSEEWVDSWFIDDK